GVMKVEGVIYDSEPVLKALQKFKESNHIKAIIVRIDSPGGVVGASQEIYSELKKMRVSKKVIASLGSLGASGAYYIACGADKIVANPGTLTGSIGVIMEFANLQKLYQWAKMDHTVIKSGRYKDVGSPLRPMNPDEKELLNHLVKNVHQQFKGVVLAERKIAFANVETVTDGRVFTGEEAKQLGLVDQLGNFQDAIEVAKELAGLKGKPELVYPPKEKMPLWKYFIGETTTRLVDSFLTRETVFSPLLYLMPLSAS
ncbi:MAG: signal peptide peptidase SppA, partial [Deltaproteobacteria bacterium]|nr:signal peptide peptidase SppA [Deltaproteobacteria bacterium]